jgi:hypothetical protein
MNENANASRSPVSRRDMLAGAAGVLAASAVSSPVFAAGSKSGAAPQKPTQSTGARTMSYITTKDKTEIYYKDWAPASQSSSTTDGLSRRTIGMLRCCFSWSAAIA